MAQAVLPSAVYNDTLKGVAQPESALPKPFARNVSECKETMASSRPYTAKSVQRRLGMSGSTRTLKFSLLLGQDSFTQLKTPSSSVL